MKWRNSKERELLATGTGSRDQTLPNKNNPNPDLSDTVCDRNQSASPGSTSSTHSDMKVNAAGGGGGGALAATSGDSRDDAASSVTVPDKELRNDGNGGGMYGHMESVAPGPNPAAAMQTSSSSQFLANIYNSKLGYPSMKSHTYKVVSSPNANADYDDSSDSSMNSDEEINVT